MKTEINKSVKRALSMVIAVALLLGTLFTANVGVNIKADAATGTTGRIEYWDGSSDSSLTGSGTEAEPYLITNAAEFNYVCTVVDTASTTGKYYKVDPGIKAFVMQSEATVNKLGGLNAFINTESAAATQSLFETAADKGATITNWLKNWKNLPFNGNIDGSGVQIYGVYSDVTTRASWAESCGLIPSIDGGGTNSGTKENVETDTTGITLKNFAIRNSYFRGWRRVAALSGTAFGGGYGAFVNGAINLDCVEVTNCFLVGQNLHYSALKTNGNTEMAVLCGSMDYDPVRASNILLNGNATEYRTFATAEDTEYTTTPNSFDRVFSQNVKNTTSGVYGELHNAIIIGAKVKDSNLTWNAEYVTNVFTTDTTAFVNTTAIADKENFKGVIGKTIMSSLNWATAATAGNGTVQWYARENDYPTLFMPDGWQDTVVAYSVFTGTAAAAFAGGDGTKANPYLIETPDQLYKMVTDGETELKYYKVADGIDTLYLNNIVATNDAATNYSAIKALVDGGSYSKWNAAADFYGNFDGNGVKIVGMVSYNGKGFVGKMCNNATVKNVNFESCYVYSSNRAAVVATDFGLYNEGDHYPTISNVSVRKSYINSQQGGITLKDSEPYAFWYSTAGGIASFNSAADMLTITNCLYDGTSSELVQKAYTPDGDVEVDARAGIVSFSQNANNLSLSNCVSLGAPIITEGVGKGGAAINYARYKSGTMVSATNCYTNTDLTLTSIDGTKVTADYWTNYPLPTTINRVDATDNIYTINDFLYLDWAGNWKLVAIDENTVIPMPGVSMVEPLKTSFSSFSKMLSEHNGVGLRSGAPPTQNGTYGWFSELTGNGTEADPYIIDTPEKLAIAIATGGKNVNNTLYYKLGCDINLGLLPWIDLTAIREQYKYVEFVGTLDGDGYTVTGLSSTNDTAAGLIPVLSGGTVKNLHIRYSYAGSTGSAGVIAGIANDGTIIGCSIENSNSAGANTGVFYGSGSATVKDSYSIVDDTATYYLANGTVGTPTDFYAKNNTDAVWYKGASGTARLVNFAKAHTIADIEGNGVVDAYDIGDVVALRNFLLDVDGYANIYGDVSGNGVTNISDLAIIRREMVGAYGDIKDGFWRNVELGAVKIYYDQNDSQDMARKLELYLESVYPQVDIVKVAGTDVTDTTVGTKAKYAGENNAIVITKTAPTEETYMNYSVNYNASTNVLTVNGNSFTAVEQAVLDLISQFKTNGTTANPAGFTGSILSADTTKQFKRVYTSSTNYVDCYYAWGDEFNEGTTYSGDNWQVRPYKGEGSDLDGVAATDAAAGNTRFLHQENPNADDVEKLWKVNDGKLTIWRGYNVDATNAAWSDDYLWGYQPIHAGASGTTNDFGSVVDADDVFIDPGIIQTSQSMMFKQGYAEMRGSLPSDGHAFPAWWVMNGASFRYNGSVSQFLYSKIYKYNDSTNNVNSETRWDGRANTLDPTKLTTYRYQLPQAFLEFDIVEFMQAQSGYKYLQLRNRGISTGDWRDYINLTIHKYYNSYATSDNAKLYIANWNTGLASTTPISQYAFNNTASGNDFIHRYDPVHTVSAHPHSYTTGGLWWENEVDTAASYSVAKAISNGAMSSGTVTDYYTYGFYWTVNESAKTYSLIIYIDFDRDGIMQYDEMIFSLDQDVGHETEFNGNGLGTRSLTDPIYSDDGSKYGITDAQVWNQYAYMLLDNSFYTSNPFGIATKTGSSNTEETGVTLFTDLLTQNSGTGTAYTSDGKDKATFDIDYVRVYQQDGRRDLVTGETEAFNTGNHFGY